tara:strand:- start:322 stop:2145 length:1824 start_codon:yes stop_codon:yes gene_type:complete
MRLSEYLKKYFGHDSFREKQIQIIKGALKKNDQLVILPTGSGKSICYQLPALLGKGITVIISPLCSLIKDQVVSLKKKNIEVYSIYGDTSINMKTEICNNIIKDENDIKILYTTPETLDSNINLIESLLNLYHKGKLERFVIDEAHCISLWGNDFRASYRNLSKIKDKFKGISIMALTATATIPVRKDIVNLLKFNKYKEYTKSYYRPNLNIKIMNKDKDHFNNLLIILKTKANQCGIIYCNSRKRCDELSEKLCNKGINCISYHAGLNNKERTNRENQWRDDIIHIVVATVAFGMGIDKCNVRFVIHYNIPSSIENYYQEIGRSGRDGLMSECILYYSYNDKIIWERLLRQNEFGFKKNDYIDHQICKLNDMCKFCENILECRHCLLSSYLGENVDFEKKCNISCDNCKLKDKIKMIDVSKLSYTLIDIIINLGDIATKKKIKQMFISNPNYIYFRDKYKGVNQLNNIYNRTILYLVLNKYIREVSIKENYWYEKYFLDLKSKKIFENKIKIEIPIYSTISSNVCIDDDKMIYENSEIYEKLKTYRTVIAKNKNIPYYCIFKNISMLDMAKHKPKNKEELININGLGIKTVELYGDDMLKIINNSN